jgi:DNA-binding transcriptional MerR regulator
VQISELVQSSGVPLARVKFYIREGMLPPGKSLSATRSDYSEEHLRRLRLIRSLTEVAGLPLSRTRRILDILDKPEGPVVDLLGQAISALSVDTEDFAPSDVTPVDAYPRARAVIELLGGRYEPRMPALAQLEYALIAVEEAGMSATAERLQTYGPHIWAIAEAELAELPADDPTAAVERAVLGTTLYEPVIAALRRLAHQNITASKR